MNYTQLIHRTDPDLVLNGMNIIKANHLANNNFLPDTNPLKFNSQDAIDAHFNGTRPIAINDVKAFMATSVISHCFDGWIYLSHAVDSLLKGDKGIAIHLAYYAELRGTLSFLARQGVSVHNGKSFGINNTGILQSTGAGGTHVAAWNYLKEWTNSTSLDRNSLLKYFTVNGKNLGDWVNHVQFPISQSLASYYTLEWMKEWSFDVQNYENDKNFRNIVTYQPQRLVNNGQIDFNKKFAGVANIWKFIEPNGSDKFALLDKYLFLMLFQKIHNNPGISGSGISLEDLTDRTFTAAGLNQDPSIRSIMASGINSSILTYAKDRAISQPNGELMPLNIISRALLMLRISSGCAFDLMNSAGINKGNIDFYINSLGNNSGYWKGATPTNFQNLWGDVNESIMFIDEMLQDGDDIILSDLYKDWPSELHYFKQISRASFWGCCT